MNNIHAPTVESGPTSGRAAANGHNKDKLSLMELIEEKDRVEGEMKALSGVLDSHGVNMNTSLLTFDGFPRADLDIAQIRTTRQRIICLQNDYKDLMNRIEKGLHEHHARIAANSELDTPSPSADVDMPDSAPSATTTAASRTIPIVRPTESTPEDIVETPFAKVNAIAPESPAAEAGLQPGDRIRSFGPINWMNHEKLSKVAEVVQRNERRPILVKVVRKDANAHSFRELQMQLVPRKDWGGRGMLGCHLVPA